MMEEALVARLVALGTAAGDRISWGAPARGDALPYTVLSRVSLVEEWTHDGPDGLDQSRVQFDHYAATAEDAMAVARAMKPAMQSAATVAGVKFHPAELADFEGPTDEGEQDGGAPLWRVRNDFQFYHEET